MKTKKIISKTLMSLSLVGVLMSCSTSNEVVSNSIFQKRKYNKGWYVNSSDKVAKKSTTSEGNSSINELENTVINKLVMSNPINNTVDTINTTQSKSTIALTSKEYLKEDIAPTNESSKKIVLASNNKNEAITIVKTTNPINYSIESYKKISNTKKTNKSKSGGVKVLLIILAFFIPFLASGIATNWKDLIWLYTLLWTLLFFIPGLIHAIIHISKN